MKGRKLILQEVLNLEDGTKVWVEDTDENFESILCQYNKNTNRLLDISDKFVSYYELTCILNYGNRLTFYEWIEDSEIVEIKSNVPIRCSTCYKLSEEVCNLRGLDLTDDNIRLIVEEFGKEK